ncbi:hypothetical protein BDV95DRAFT_626866 [Massariosphaeria phaeospora]|uniref:Uncharacterized protein n=1 Tax=Massariosphaeria phaeospora TaxID=100035 RepID=A0A7C8MIB1_9PLEO|nr:hypothetical protein BDV95DRAFT_626866 [Massariosphaeria phaeospora]
MAQVVNIHDPKNEEPQYQSAGNGPQQLELNIPVLRLLHHFQTVTARTLVADPGTEDMYQSYLIKLGLDYTFLLHAVLALAALHLSRLEKQHRSEYLNRAVSHHDVALAQFKDQVQDLNEDNFQAVLFFASTMFPYSCAIPLENGDTLTDIFSGILSNIELTRRMRAMVTGVYQAMLQSEIARLVPVDTQGIDWHNSEPPQTTELGTLRKFAEATRGIYPPDIVDAYGHAIHVLDIAYSKISELLHPPSDALLKMWIHMITPRFMELLSERQPGALIIFSHYGVLLGRGKHYWFLDGLAEQILHIADAFVPTEWTKWLEWPREQIFKDRTQLNTA